MGMKGEVLKQITTFIVTSGYECVPAPPKNQPDVMGRHATTSRSMQTTLYPILDQLQLRIRTTVRTS